MRLSGGKNQEGLFAKGISRRHIQRAEYGYNITLVKLFSLLGG
jgi:hypothetical protein